MCSHRKREVLSKRDKIEREVNINSSTNWGYEYLCVRNSKIFPAPCEFAFVMYYDKENLQQHFILQLGETICKFKFNNGNKTEQRPLALNYFRRL